MRICVIGMGYVGLPTALMLAVSGHVVVGSDINDALVKNLRSGAFGSPEPGLNALYRRALKSQRVVFSDKPSEADAYILALPTPVRDDHRADLSAIRQVAGQMKPHVQPGTLVILESTVPPGTTNDLAKWIGEPRALYAHVPERVLPGNLISELKHNGRIVGGLTDEATRLTARLYQSFVEGPIRETEATIAEMAKLMENTHRDVNIALANEFSRVCHRMGISARQAIALANEHPRVNILQPGLGVGGHCIAVDPWFIVEACPDESRLIRRARLVNDTQPAFVVRIMTELFDGSLAKLRIAVLGLAYKGDVDDSRESPSGRLLSLLERAGATVRVHDPLVSSLQQWKTEPLSDLFPWADAIIVATGHSAYRKLTPDLLRTVRADVRVLDTPGVLDRKSWDALGLSIETLGDEGRQGVYSI